VGTAGEEKENKTKNMCLIGFAISFASVLHTNCIPKHWSTESQFHAVFKKKRV
jgi:hypothetical protein